MKVIIVYFEPHSKAHSMYKDILVRNVSNKPVLSSDRDVPNILCLYNDLADFSLSAFKCPCNLFANSQMVTLN